MSKRIPGLAEGIHEEMERLDRMGREFEVTNRRDTRTMALVWLTVIIGPIVATMFLLLK